MRKRPLLLRHLQNRLPEELQYIRNSLRRQHQEILSRQRQPNLRLHSDLWIPLNQFLLLNSSSSSGLRRLRSPSWIHLRRILRSVLLRRLRLRSKWPWIRLLLLHSSSHLSSRQLQGYLLSSKSFRIEALRNSK